MKGITVTNAAEEPIVTLDISDPIFLADRFRTYREIQASNPVARTLVNDQSSWLLTRYRDVERILKDPMCVVEPVPGQIPAHVGDGPAAQFYRLSLPNMDPPQHTRLRRLAGPAFAPRAIASMRGWVEEIISAGIDRLAEFDSEVDFVSEFATRVPAQIACRLLHAPAEDAATVLQRMPALNAVLSQSEITSQQLAEADEVAQFYFDYIGGIVDGNRGRLSADDPVGALLAAEEAGDKLSREELVVTLVGFFVASYHTTMVAMTNTVAALLANRDQYVALQKDPSLAGNAWEESLRYDAPVHFIWRYAPPGLEIAGKQIDAGSHLLLGLAAANRDPEKFDNPDSFDLTRARIRHLAFTAGGHFCLGAPLSRIEGEILLRLLPEKLPNIELREKNPPRIPDLTFPAVTQLRVSPHGR
ncbi:cytochrome P450 [Rhodococcus sp. NPDC127530]|uniref:cytochrome P450 n=1 Tax=unclassified Rhodococcus (in: high G+C Gram-positive bacteria) TaxID=192944 RepID=UPI0036272D2C